MPWLETGYLEKLAGRARSYKGKIIEFLDMDPS